MYREDHYLETEDKLKVVVRYDVKAPRFLRVSVLKPWLLNKELYYTVYYEVYDNVMSLTTREVVAIVTKKYRSKQSEY